MTNLGTRLLTWLRGELVGSDKYGNRYYRLTHDKPSGRGGGRSRAINHANLGRVARG